MLDFLVRLAVQYLKQCAALRVICKVMCLHFVGLLSLVLSKKLINMSLLNAFAKIGYFSIIEGRVRTS